MSIYRLIQQALCLSDKSSVSNCRLHRHYCGSTIKWISLKWPLFAHLITMGSTFPGDIYNICYLCIIIILKSLIIINMVIRSPTFDVCFVVLKVIHSVVQVHGTASLVGHL